MKNQISYPASVFSPRWVFPYLSLSALISPYALIHGLFFSNLLLSGVHPPSYSDPYSRSRNQTNPRTRGICHIKYFSSTYGSNSLMHPQNANTHTLHITICKKENMDLKDQKCANVIKKVVRKSMAASLTSSGINTAQVINDFIYSRH